MSESPESAVGGQVEFHYPERDQKFGSSRIIVGKAIQYIRFDVSKETRGVSDKVLMLHFSDASDERSLEEDKIKHLKAPKIGSYLK